MTVELLPDNTFAIMRSVDAVNAARRPLPAELIKQVDDPLTCPERLLGYCAYHYSVDLWDETWPAAKKRSVIAESIKLARIKGTEAAITRAVEIAGGKVERVIAPPASLFLSADRTPEEKAAWLARMPQLRIYPQRPPRPWPGYHCGQAFPAFLRDTDAHLTATPRLTLFKNGVETELQSIERRLEDLTIVEAEEFVQARVPTRAPGYFCGQAFPAFLAESTARESVYNLRTRRTLEIPGTETFAQEVGRPSLQPIDVRAETVRPPMPFQGIWGGQRCFPGFGVSRFAHASTARYGVYKRIRLLDPDAPSMGESGRVFFDYNFRFGQPAYQAEIRVHAEFRVPAATFEPIMAGFLTGREDSALRPIAEAVETHKSLRDRILIDTRTRDEITFGLNVVFGEDVVAGQIVAL